MTTTTYAADRTALLIVDPYNDFMSEGGKFYEATKETTGIEPATSWLQTRRSKRSQVVIL